MGSILVYRHNFYTNKKLAAQAHSSIRFLAIKLAFIFFSIFTILAIDVALGLLQQNDAYIRE